MKEVYEKRRFPDEEEIQTIYPIAPALYHYSILDTMTRRLW